MSERTSSEIRGRDTEDAGKRQAETSRTIDALYDKVETYVAGIGRIVNVDTSGEVTDARTVRPGHSVAYHNAPAIASPTAKALPAPRPVDPDVDERRFKIVEITVYEVTNGVARARFATRGEAEAVLAKIREAGQ